jgi:hypothetical protein
MLVLPAKAEEFLSGKAGSFNFSENAFTRLKNFPKLASARNKQNIKKIFFGLMPEFIDIGKKR